MLKRLEYNLSPKWEQAAQTLLLSLEKEGIACVPVSPKIFTLPVCRSDSAHLLFLTDDPAAAKAASAQGVICIGAASSLDGYFEGTELVLESFDGIDRQFLEEYLLRSQNLPVTIARTNRLILREIIPSDFETLYDISRQTGMEYARADRNGENSFSPQRLHAYIRQQYRFYGYGLWTVYLPAAHPAQVIGCCGFSEFSIPHISDEPLIFLSKTLTETDEPDYSPLILELQYFLDEDYRRQGFGTEMCRAALSYAEERLGAACIWVRVHPNNPAALSFAERLGFRRINVADSPLFR